MRINPLKDGDLVFAKEEKLDGFLSEARNKIKGGRVGVVRYYNHAENGYPFRVIYPKEGRKKEYSLHSGFSDDFELVD